MPPRNDVGVTTESWGHMGSFSLGEKEILTRPQENLVTPSDVSRDPATPLYAVTMRSRPSATARVAPRVSISNEECDTIHGQSYAE